MRQSLTYVEFDLDGCSLTFAIPPCAAAIPTTGDHKCFNSIKTCQDREHFTAETFTLRFGMNVSYRPVDIECVPLLRAVSVTPGAISLGKDLGVRATVTAVFGDGQHSDTLPGYVDKYLADRGYDPIAQGTFWGKFRARYPFVRGRPLRFITGFVGQTLAEMETRHYVMESFDGPTPKGSFTLTAKDVLKLADDDRAQAPALSNGQLVADIDAVVTEFVATPAGIGESEYPISGYLAVGGKESMKFNRDAGLDSFTKLLLHMDGTNGSTTFTDSSASAHTVTRQGNAQLTTSQFKFGTASGVFDGATDYLTNDGSADFAFGAADFTVDFWLRLNVASVQRDLYDSRPSAGTGLYPLIILSAANVLVYEVNGTNRITGTTAVVINTWYHVALVRSTGTTRLYLNGSQEGADYTDANVYIVGASRPTIGANGNSAGANSLNGWLDELRVSNGIARWTDAFVPAARAYSATSGDVFNVVRGQLNSDAVTHTSGDRVQLGLVFLGENPANIIYTLFTAYATVDPIFIPLANWLVEIASYLQRVYTAYIMEPVGVNALVSELIEQAALAIWWDDVNQQVKLQVLRPVTTSALLFDETNTLKNSLNVKEQPDKRISEVWIYHALRNPLEPLTNTDNYLATLIETDLDAATDYGSPVVKVIYSRWIPQFGTAVARRVALIQLSRYRDPPRQVMFDAFRDEAGTAIVELGGGYRVAGWSIQDDQGAPTYVPVQVTGLQPKFDRWSATAEEALFANLDPTDLTNRVITLDSDALSVNLRTLHDLLYPEIGPGEASYITVTCIINTGVIIGAATTADAALDIGLWPNLPDIVIRPLGRIEGAGGAGGHGDNFTPGPGHAGGTALKTTVAISLEDGSGEVWGGGGGGAGGGTDAVSTGAGGGGGAGSVPGVGGAGTNGGTNPGAPGTTEVGGIGTSTASGSPPGKGGNGGGPGLAGQQGTSQGNGPIGVAGAAGKAIDGISHVTQIGSPGDRRGPETG